MKRKIAKILCAIMLIAGLQEYAPADGMAALQQMRKLQEDDRQELNFNTNWLFIDEDDAAAQEIAYDETKAQNVSLPHATGEYDLFFADETDWQKVTWYRRHFTIPAEEKGKQITVSFDGGGQINEVYVNGAYVGKAQGTFTHFSFDITDYVTCGNYDNVISVRVDSRYHYDTLPPAENDFHWMGGLHGDAVLSITDKLHLESAFYWTEKTGEETYREGEPVLLKGQVEVKNGYLEDYPVKVKVRLSDAQGNEKALEEASVEIRAGESETAEFSIQIDDPELWDTEHPYLYNVETWLESEGVRLDSITGRTGLRWISSSGKTAKNTVLTPEDDQQIFLNDKPLVLYGINKNQQFSYIGNSGTKKLYEKDAYTLKYDLGMNFVRTAHYENDPDFFEACDEIGLLVEEEALGWNTMPAAAREQFAYSVREMVKRDRNHPSIILWSIMPNEGTEANYPVAERQQIQKDVKELDSSRLTIQEEMYDNYTFVADVYANHDYAVSTLANPIKAIKRQPYIIGEWNDNLGRVFVNPYDSEDRKIRQVTDDGKKMECFLRDATVDGIVKWDFNGYLTTINNDKWGKTNGAYRISGVYGPFKDPLVRYWEADMMRVQTDSSIVGNVVKIMNEWKSDSPSVVYVAANAKEAELFLEKSTGERNSLGKIAPNYLTGLPQGLFRWENVEWEEGSALVAVSYDKNGVKLGEDIRYASSYDVPGEAVYELTNATKNEYDSAHYQTYGQEYVKDNLKLQADGSDLAVLMGVLKDENGQKLDYAYENTSFEIVSGPGKLITGPRVYMLGGVNSCYLQSEYGKTGETVVQAKVDVGEMINQDHEAFTYSQTGWNTVENKAYAYGGDYRKSTQKDAWAEFSFTGTQAVLYAHLEATGYGQGSVTVDGRDAGKIQFMKGENKVGDMNFQPIFETEELEYGSHTIRITADSANAISIDACKVFDGEADLVSNELTIVTEALEEKEAVCDRNLPSAPRQEIVSAENIRELLEEAEQYDLENYEALGSMALFGGMRFARRVLQSASPSQEQLREAKRVLSEAINGLNCVRTSFSNKSVSDNEGGMSGFYRYAQAADTWNDTGDELYANKNRTRGDFISLAFEGTGIRLYGKTDSNHGYAEIWLDGEMVLKLDQYSQTEVRDVLMYENTELEEGRHQIKIVVTGESSGNPDNACVGVCYAEVYKNGAGKSTEKSALEEKLAEMRQMDLSGYSSKKQREFEDSMEDAAYLLSHPLVSETEIAEGVRTLERAKEKLECIEVERISTAAGVINLNKGESSYLQVTVLPADATDKGLIFTSKNPAVVSVDDKGQIKALAVGTAEITIQSVQNPDIAVSVTVYVAETKPLAAVGNLTVSGSDTSSVNLSWRAVTNASGYFVYRKGPADAAFVKIYDGQAVSVKDVGLKAGTLYSYQVEAYGISNGKQFTGPRSAVLQAATLPKKPSLKVKKAKNGKAALSWKKSSGGTHVEIWMKTGKGKFKRIKNVSAGKLKYSKKLKKGQTYQFKIRAFVNVAGKKYYGKYSRVRKLKL